MTRIISRRSLLATGTLGLGAFALPGFARAQSILAARGFTHAVASGEPASDSLLLWTRFVPEAGDHVEVVAEISESADFARVVATGAQITGAWRDWTAKVTLEGLRPATAYFYRFRTGDQVSAVGRAKTLPDGDAAGFKAAIFSCSNLPVGWFNAYGHAAARDDLDLWVHLGDYFYEGDGTSYAIAPERIPQPAAELLHLADYRLRYASYRADPDLQALHLRTTMVAQWDDHESANDSWEGGAGAHDPATEGDWLARRAAAIQAYREWMPVSDEPWKAYDVGGLATLFRTETRLFARTEQPAIDPLLKASDPTAALTAFRDGAWQDPGASMMGSQQEVWLHHALAASTRTGRRWQVVGFGTIMGQTYMPEQAGSWLKRDASDGSKRFVLDGVAAAKLGLPFNYDNWGGYPAARARFLRQARETAANLVLISGDSHNAWAYDLRQDGGPAGVEFAGMSVSSNGFENDTGVDPRTVARAFVAASPELTWCDTSRRGYMVLSLTPETVTNEWWFVDTVKQRRATAGVGHRATVTRGRNAMTV